MGKIKIHEIAKKLDLTSKEVLDIAKKLNIEAKSHLSGVEESEAKKIEEEAKNMIKNKSGNKDASAEKTAKSKNEQKGKTEKTSKKAEKKQEKAPVIIRREVIIEQEKPDSKKEATKKSDNRNNIGFVERRKNTDYNIVYRNKTSRPMTVSELFGLNKDKKPKEEETKADEITEPKTEPQPQPQQPESNLKVEKPQTKPTVEQSQVKQPQTVAEVEKTKDKVTKPENDRFNKNNINNKREKEQQSKMNNHNNNRNYQNRRPNNNNNNFGKNNRFNNRNKPLDEKGIEKNIKNIMSSEVGEKEPIREYNKSIDKQKNNSRFEENKNPRRNRNKRNHEGNDFDQGKLKSLKQTDRLSNMFDEQDGGMLDYYDLTTERGRKGKKKNNKAQGERTKQKIFKLTEIEIPETITVKDLAAEMKKTTAEVIKKLLSYGIMATINNELDFDTAYLVAQEFGITAKKKETVTEEDILFDDSEDKEEDLEVRPPVVVVMGHVDHGKTSLLDTIRKTNVIEGEAGGITQAIGAYKVKVRDREITFLDTPGHEAFTAMRARGAQITDIAILVVAANDGVKPQTVEAINHAKSAGIPIIVAINKIDLPDANVERVKEELMKYDLVPEEWGGNTIMVPISAKKHENIDQLLEMVLLEADILELKANPHKQAKGTVIEARLDQSRGAIATMLVQRGTLDVGDTIVVGSSIGRIRAMKDDKGKSVKSAGPSTPVEIMGLTDVPEAGDTFYEVKNEKMAKHLIERRKRQAREKAINSVTKVTLDNLFSQMEQGKLKVLNLIVKADVQGSVEAVSQSLEKLQNEEVKVKVIHAAVGAVNQSDVTLAKVSNAIIIAFNVRPDHNAKEMAEKDGIEIKQYSVIYQVIDDVEAAMKGMLEPKYEEKVIGNAEVRQTFKISNVGTVAGCYVTSGKVERNAGVRVIRDNVVIHDGHLATLKRFKDDVKEVSKGFECGIQIENYSDVKEGDIIEVYIMEEIKK